SRWVSGASASCADTPTTGISAAAATASCTAARAVRRLLLASVWTWSTQGWTPMLQILQSATKLCSAHVHDERSALLTVLNLDEELSAARAGRHDRQRKLVRAGLEVRAPPQLTLILEAVQRDRAGQHDANFGILQRRSRVDRYAD